MIVQELLRLQSRHGYLPRQQLAALADRLKVPLYRVHEVASFFPHFRVFKSDAEERREAGNLPQYEVTVCRDMTCRLRGSGEYLDKLTAETREYGAKVNVCGVSCLGAATALRPCGSSSTSPAATPRTTTPIACGRCWAGRCRR
jgi:NADH:ubiquinone oxidoreductase subunit E